MTTSLADIIARASDPRALGHHKPCTATVCGSRVCQTARDRDALLGALQGVLKVLESFDDSITENYHTMPTVVSHYGTVIITRTHKAIEEHVDLLG